MQGIVGAKPVVLVVGSINMDLVLQTPSDATAGESLIGQTYHHIPGGKGANRAVVAAARLGADVTLAGKVGEDVNGMKLREHLDAQASPPMVLSPTQTARQDWR